MANLEQVAASIKAAFPHLEPQVLDNGWVEVRVSPEELLSVCQHLRDQIHFKYLANLTSVDWLEKGFEVVYHLIDLDTNNKVVLKVTTPRDVASVPSVVAIWPTANWQEREVWDLMGIRFEGHPDLRRILMQEGWKGHPLRKDYEDWRPVRERKTRETYKPGPAADRPLANL